MNFLSLVWNLLEQAETGSDTTSLKKGRSLGIQISSTLLWNQYDESSLRNQFINLRSLVEVKSRFFIFFLKGQVVQGKKQHLLPLTLSPETTQSTSLSISVKVKRVPLCEENRFSTTPFFYEETREASVRGLSNTEFGLCATTFFRFRNTEQAFSDKKDER